MGINIKPVAIYLPQFHPIPENDAWWGKGFSEWTNVTAAKPLFKGHYQPQLPSGLGYYDLRVAEARKAQAELARQYGIHGFCYYHYWFNGKRLLERPFEEVLRSGEPDFPFMLFWANETWSRRWLGEEQEVLIRQEYSAEDDERHADYLVRAFSDPRYIRVDNKPVFIIYRPLDLPDVQNTIAVIRRKAAAAGMDVVLAASNSHVAQEDYNRLLQMGFDCLLNFRPQLGALPQFMENSFSWKRFFRNMIQHARYNGKLKLYSYREALEKMQSWEPADFSHTMPCVFAGWDNTARRGDKAVVVYGNEPALFGAELKRVKQKMEKASVNDLLFVNAWNEWAEGNHLEPDLKNGYELLKQLKNVFS
ncbi:MAG TPA: glycoside hydrolase family 99-like domain-containing protein [Panacibacter sp.]|nr:glycoside hydrolase family 99-like domain-containing protein [Panacibacter sp.]HNP46545.1 glycoside hydrolase family 99-like domain-containing protein [Panacibacter sp.]